MMKSMRLLSAVVFSLSVMLPPTQAFSTGVMPGLFASSQVKSWRTNAARSAGLKLSGLRSSSMTATLSRAPTTPFVLNLAGDTALTIKNFNMETAKDCIQAVNKLVTSFNAMKKAEAEGKRAVQDTITWSWRDDDFDFSLECNPNLFVNAFNAQVFITFKDANVKMSSQMKLPTLIDTLKDFKSKNPE